MEHIIEANWQWSNNTFGIKESKHIPFSLVHEKNILNLIEPTHLQCFSNCLSSIRVKHHRQDMLQNSLPIRKPKIILVFISRRRILRNSDRHGSRSNGIIHFSCMHTSLTAPEAIKILVGDLSPINNGRTLCLTEIGKDLECSQSNLGTNREWFHSTIVILVSESIPCWLHESEDI